MFRAFRIFLKAIDFEYDHEKMYKKVFNFEGFLVFYPRSLVIYSKTQRFSFYVNYLLYPLLFIVYPLLLNPILVLFYFFRSLLPLLRASQENIPSNIFLSLSHVKFLNYLDVNEKNYPEALIEFPFYRAHTNIKPGLNGISFFRVTNAKHFFRAFLLALATPFLLLFNNKRHLMLYTYSAFYWYWTYLSFYKTEINSLWFSNHYDRWSKLIDYLPEVKEKVLIQHGQLEYVEIETGNVFFPSFKENLKSISRVYMLDVKSELFFRKLISKESVNFSLIRSKLILLPWRKTKPIILNILIVGHHNDFNFHLALIERLKLHNIFNISYKLHPLQSIVNKEFDFWVVRIAEELPMADFVISYGSSLDNEIKQMLPEVSIIYYGFNEKFNAKEAIDSIETQLFNLMKIENNPY